MITEETIKQTRFFRGVDDKFYMVSEVEDVKLVTLKDCADGSTSVLMLGDDEVCGTFDPVEASFKAFIEDQVAAARPLPVAKPAGRSKPGITSMKKSATGFLGVKKEKPYKDGREKFTANYRKDGKFIHIGTFENIYLAAAAVQEQLGYKEEAQRLRDMAEQADNNPDRPAGRKCKKTIWVCKRCGLQYKSKGTCADCGYDDMREVPAGK